MTTVGLPATSTYTTIGLVSCLVTPPARAYGSEGWGFESLRARSLPAKTACRSARDTPVADTFLILSVVTVAACVFVQNIPHVWAAGVPLQIVRLRSG